MARLTLGLALIGATAGVAGILLYFSTIPLQSVVRGDELQLIFDRLGLQLWVLEIILVITALIFAIIGVIGYQAIKDEATKQAVEQAEKQVRDFLDNRRKDEGLSGTAGEPREPGHDFDREASDEQER